MLVFGPLNKDRYTKKFELFVKCVLQWPDEIHYRLYRPSLDAHQVLLAQVGQAHINVSSMLQKVNYNHIYLSEGDSDNYQKTSFLSTLSYPHINFNQEKYPNLTPAEIQAIWRYSNEYYENINAFLNGFTGQFNKILKESTPWQLNMCVNDLIANIALLSSGLNKIIPNADFKGPVFRGEAIPPEILDYRMKLQENHKIDRNLSFISTSGRKKVAENYTGTSLIEFENPHAKDISGLSKYPGEDEYLLPPNQSIIWNYVSRKKEIYFFSARVVAPLIKETYENIDDDEETKKLSDFFQKKRKY